MQFIYNSVAKSEKESFTSAWPPSWPAVPGPISGCAVSYASPVLLSSGVLWEQGQQKIATVKCASRPKRSQGYECCGFVLQIDKREMRGNKFHTKMELEVPNLQSITTAMFGQTTGKVCDRVNKFVSNRQQELVEASAFVRVIMSRPAYIFYLCFNLDIGIDAGH